MPDVFRSLLRTVDMANGENDGTWGNKIDDTLTILEEAIAGETAIATTGGDTTLSTANNATDQARKMILRVTGTLASNANIIVPSTTKTYDVRNATTGAYTVTVKVAGQTGVVIPQGGAARVAVTSAGDVELIARRDPTNDFEAADRTKLDGIESGAQVNVGTNLTYTAGTRTLNSSTGADVVLPIADASNAGLLTAGLIADAGKVLRVAAGGGYELVAIATGDGDMLRSIYDPANVAEQLVGLTATQTLTNKTLTSPTITGNLSLTGSVTMTEGAGSGGAANSVANNLILDSDNASVGMSFLNAGVAYVQFGDATDNDVGEIAYIHASDTLRLRAGGTNTLYVRNGRLGIGEDAPAATLHLNSVSTYVRLEDSDGVLGGSMSAGHLFYAQGNLHGRLGFIGTSAGTMRIDNMQGSLQLFADTNNAHNNSRIELYLDNSLTARAALESGIAIWDVGLSDTTQGIIRVYGNSGTAGGSVRWYNSAGEDGTHDYWEAIANLGWVLQTNDNVDAIQVSTTHDVTIPNGDLTVSGGAVAVNEGAGSGATAHSTADNFVIDSDQASAGLSILTPNTGTGYVNFGDAGDNDAGALWYQHSTDTIGVRVAGATRVTIDAAGIYDDGNDPTTAAQLANKQYVDAQIAANAGADWTLHATTSLSGQEQILVATNLPACNEIMITGTGVRHTVGGRSVLVRLGDSGGIETSGYVFNDATWGFEVNDLSTTGHKFVIHLFATPGDEGVLTGRMYRSIDGTFGPAMKILTSRCTQIEVSEYLPQIGQFGTLDGSVSVYYR